MSDTTENPNSSFTAGVLTVLRAESAQQALLCYGLDAGACSLHERQLAFLDLLARTILTSTQTGNRVLLCGPDLGELARRHQSEASFVWTGGSHLGSGEPVKALSTPLDILIVDSRNEFDCIVLEGSYAYLNQLDIFQQARRLLVENGRLLLVGEFLSDDSKIGKSSLANLSSCYQLAERLGFSVVVSDDFSPQAAATLDSFRELVLAHQARQSAGQGVDLAALLTRLDEMRTEFAGGRRVLRLMELVRNRHGLGEYADAEYGDINSFQAEEIAPLFERSFDNRFDLALWKWKYQLGGGKCVVAREKRSGPIVSHYGGAPRQIHYFGRSATAIQVCDVMVLPEKRLHYGKNSLFFKTAATFLEREIGNTVNHLLGFGFPNQKAMNIALRLGLYEKTDDFVELVFPGAMSRDDAWVWTDVDWQDSGHLARLDALWQAMAPDFEAGIIGVRHSAYLSYRYHSHPWADSYRCGFISTRGEPPLGFVALKTHEQATLIMDLLAPLQHIGEVVLGLRSLMAASQTHDKLKLWLTRGWTDRLDTSGAAVNALNIEIPCNSWNPGPSAQTLYGAWWLTAGDMDFI